MVSVCMATYNGENYIQEQLQSILKQLAPGDEVIISDDASTDATIEQIMLLGDNRIKIIPHIPFSSKYKGKLRQCHRVSTNFANALSHASGDYIFLADQDDVWCADKVKVMMNYLKDYDFVVSDCQIVDSNLHHIKDSYLENTSLHNSPWPYLIKNRFLGCCMAFRKEMLAHAFPWPQEPVMHDHWLLLTSLRFGKCHLISDPCILYRRHSDNTSTASHKSNTSLGFKIAYRMLVAKAFFKLLKTPVK